jgi:hypothetical protein
MRHAAATAIALSALALAAPARADDCTQWSAQLIGADADTIGVTVDRDSTGAWTMAVRPKPGADVVESTVIDVPTDHAHVWVYVSPGRKRIVWILASSDHQRVRPGEPFVWTYDARGKRLHTGKLGAVFTQDELDRLPRSISHFSWASGDAVAKGARLTIPTIAGGSIVIDDAGSRVKRRR